MESPWLMDVSVYWQWCELSIHPFPGYWRKIEMTHLWGTKSHQQGNGSFLFLSSLNFALYE